MTCKECGGPLIFASCESGKTVYECKRCVKKAILKFHRAFSKMSKLDKY